MKNLTPFLLCFLLFNFIDANGQARKGIGIMAGANLSRIQVANGQISTLGEAIDMNDDFGWQAGAQIGISATRLSSASNSAFIPDWPTFNVALPPKR